MQETNKSLFYLFTELFKITNTSYEYYPSYFMDNKFYNKNIDSYDSIHSNQFKVINKIVKSYVKYYNSNEALK